MKRLWLGVGLAAILTIGLAACGGGSGSGNGNASGSTSAADITGDLKDVSVVSSTSSGDFTPGIVAGVGSNGALKFTVAGVDIDGDGKVETPTITGVTASSGAAAMVTKSFTDTSVTCDEGTKSGEGETADKFDVGISLDTTASMGSAAGVLADKIAQFVTGLGTGFDVQFAGLTVGDAFATKLNPSTDFTDAVSQGTMGEPPSFDSCERPDTGTALVNSTNMATFFSQVKTAVGSGCSGNGGTENYLAAVEHLFKTTTWRAGSIPVIISIGDNCAYTPDTYTEDAIMGDWIPPAPATFLDEIKGRAIVHIIGHPDVADPSDPSSYGLYCGDYNYYNMKGLSDATGGQFIDIGSCSDATTCNVDLTKLPITSAISDSVNYLCDGRLSLFEGTGNVTLKVHVSATGTTSGAAKTAEVDMVLGLTF
jgi:hypothetical protein